MQELLEKLLVIAENSDDQDTLYHISEEFLGKTVTMKPRLAPYMMGIFADSEDIKIPRVSLSTSVMGALSALGIAGNGLEFYIYKLTNNPKLLVPTEDQVGDVEETGEVWALSLVKLEFVSKAKIIYKKVPKRGRGLPSGMGYIEIEEGMDEFDVKKALRTAATAGIIGAGVAGLGARKGLTQREIEKPETATKVEQPVESISIDMNRIAQIESSGNPNAVNKRTGARGLCQIMEETWGEMTGKMGVNWFWDDAFDANKNRDVADYYMNTEIPRLLKHYGLEDTIENRLASYNWGIGNLKRIGLENAPQETVDYIEKYKSL